MSSSGGFEWADGGGNEYSSSAAGSDGPTVQRQTALTEWFTRKPKRGRPRKDQQGPESKRAKLAVAEAPVLPVPTRSGNVDGHSTAMPAEKKEAYAEEAMEFVMAELQHKHSAINKPSIRKWAKDCGLNESTFSKAVTRARKFVKERRSKEGETRNVSMAFEVRAFCRSLSRLVRIHCSFHRSALLADLGSLLGPRRAL